MTHHPETLAVHNAPIDPLTGAVVPPLVFSTTFERDPDGEYPRGYSYTRTANPNRHALEQALCRMEGGALAFGVSSGSAGMMSILQALRPGDHVISGADLYHGVRVLLNDVFAPWGIDTTYIDLTDPQTLRDVIRPQTRMVILESPSNPMLRLVDIAAIAQITHEIGAVLVVDNTVATPLGQNPLALGADIVVHAVTKFIAGHSDVLSGMVITREDTPFTQKVAQIIHIGGAVPDPMACWLTLRGLQTLPHRVRIQSDTALKVADYLATHPRVESVLYPHHPSHPQYTLAQRQMRLGGGLMSVLVKGGQDFALAVAANTQLFIRATSFGGTHSLIEHRASIEQQSTTPVNLLRLSIGLEHPDDLIADLAQALG